MSKGFVEQAQQELLSSVELLYDYASSDIPILMLEPSCLSMFIDDFTGLLPGEVRAKDVAASSRGFAKLVSEDRYGLFGKAEWKPMKQGALVHGHCHDKALEGTEHLTNALSWAVGSDLKVLDSACCGMAGSFGYEREHQEVSRQMANRVLVPEINDSSGDTIVAAGTSCRAQVEDLTGRKAVHPVQLLLACLDS